MKRVIYFPDLYYQLDEYKENYYNNYILPIILKFYEEGCVEELRKKSLLGIKS